MAVVVRGTFHQGSNLFSSETRGRQCTAMSYIAMAFSSVKALSNWTLDDVDHVLRLGDELYHLLCVSLFSGSFTALTQDEMRTHENFSKRHLLQWRKGAPYWFSEMEEESLRRIRSENIKRLEASLPPLQQKIKRAELEHISCPDADPETGVCDVPEKRAVELASKFTQDRPISFRDQKKGAGDQKSRKGNKKSSGDEDAAAPLDPMTNELMEEKNRLEAECTTVDGYTEKVYNLLCALFAISNCKEDYDYSDEIREVLGTFRLPEDSCYDEIRKMIGRIRAFGKEEDGDKKDDDEAGHEKDSDKKNAENGSDGKNEK